MFPPLSTSWVFPCLLKTNCGVSEMESKNKRKKFKNLAPICFSKMCDAIHFQKLYSVLWRRVNVFIVILYNFLAGVIRYYTSITFQFTVTWTIPGYFFGIVISFNITVSPTVQKLRIAFPTQYKLRLIQKEI